MKVSDALLANALNTVGESSLITDSNQLIVFANAAFLSTTGYTAEEVVGTNCRFLQHSTTDRQTVADMRLAITAGSTFRGVLVNRRKDGSLFENSITVSPIRDERGVVSHFVSMQTDVTARAALERSAIERNGGERNAIERNGGAEPPRKPDARIAGFADLAASHSGTPSTVPESEQQPLGLNAGRVEMFMQPIVDLVSGEPVIIESLARLITPDGEIVDAATFVPSLSVAELDTLFVIGLDQSLSSLVDWHAGGLDVAISVNLDPVTLMNPSVIDWVRDALKLHDVAPHRLILELLETRAISRDRQKSALVELRELGVRLAIDDLGSGHSNLERVALYDFDVVKIDAGILNGLTASPLQTLSVIYALTQLSVNLDRDAVVEGLETPDLVGVAVVLGARLGQGYIYAHPMPATDIPAWVTSNSHGFDSEHLTTFAAVLAYHWRYSRRAPHPGEAADCPISGFLLAHGGTTPVAEWHNSQHGAPQSDSEHEGRQLMNWLADHVSAGASRP